MEIAMQIVLTPAQLQLVVNLNNSTVPMLPNPFRGWLADEIERSMVQAGMLLVREKLAVYQDRQLLISDTLLHLMQPAVQSQHAVTLQVSSNVDTTLFYGFYRSADPLNGTLIARVGVNAYAVEPKSIAHVIQDFIQYVGIPERVDYTPLAPFQISRQNVERIIRRNPEAQQPVRSYDFTVRTDSQQVAHRIMFIRNQWWYASLIGDDYRFDSIDGRGVIHLLEKFLSVEQRV
jgi:hypothetical protein